MLATPATIDMSSPAVTTRLRVASEPTPTPQPPMPVLMDSASVSARLRSVAEMGVLCELLGRGVPERRPVHAMR